MSAHTPGPWIVSHDPDAYSDDDYCIGPPDGKVDQITVLRELSECSQYWSEYDVPLGIHDRIAAALAKAGQ